MFAVGSGPGEWGGVILGSPTDRPQQAIGPSPSTLGIAGRAQRMLQGEFPATAGGAGWQYQNPCCQL
jgi:hypothetical protein